MVDENVNLVQTVNNRWAESSIRLHLTTHLSYRNHFKLWVCVILVSTVLVLTTVIQSYNLSTTRLLVVQLSIQSVFSVYLTIVIGAFTRQLLKADLSAIQLIVVGFLASVWVLPEVNPMLVGADWYAYSLVLSYNDSVAFQEFVLLWPRSRYYIVAHTLFVAQLFYSTLCLTKWVRLERTYMDGKDRSFPQIVVEKGSPSRVDNWGSGARRGSFGSRHSVGDPYRGPLVQGTDQDGASSAHPLKSNLREDVGGELGRNELQETLAHANASESGGDSMSPKSSVGSPSNAPPHTPTGTGPHTPTGTGPHTQTGIGPHTPTGTPPHTPTSTPRHTPTGTPPHPNDLLSSQTSSALSTTNINLNNASPNPSETLAPPLDTKVAQSHDELQKPVSSHKVLTSPKCSAPQSVRSVHGLIPRVVLGYFILRTTLQQVFDCDSGVVPCISWISMWRVCVQQGPGADSQTWQCSTDETNRVVVQSLLNGVELVLLAWIVVEVRMTLRAYRSFEFLAVNIHVVTLKLLVAGLVLFWGAFFVGSALLSSALALEFLFSDRLTYTGVSFWSVGITTVLLALCVLLCWGFTPCSGSEPKHKLRYVALRNPSAATNGASAQAETTLYFEDLVSMWNLSFISYLTGNPKNRLSNDDLQAMFEDQRLGVVEQIYPEHESEMFCLVAESPSSIVLAFRGRISLDPRRAGQSFLSDFEKELVLHPIFHETAAKWGAVPCNRGDEVPKVHRGLLALYETFQEAVVSNVATLLSQQHRPVFLTGHQLGGALATLASFDLSNQLQNTGNIVVYTFGSPMVGNRAFQSEYERQLNRLHINVYNAGDEWHRQPAKSHQHYCHVGQVVALDNQGDLILQPDPLESAVLYGLHSKQLSNHTPSAYTLSLMRWSSRALGPRFQPLWSVCLYDVKHHVPKRVLNDDKAVSSYLAESPIGISHRRRSFGRLGMPSVLLHFRITQVSGVSAEKCLCVVSCGMEGTSTRFWEVSKTSVASIQKRTDLFAAATSPNASTHSLHRRASSDIGNWPIREEAEEESEQGGEAADGGEGHLIPSSASTSQQSLSLNESGSVGSTHTRSLSNFSQLPSRASRRQDEAFVAAEATASPRSIKSSPIANTHPGRSRAGTCDSISSMASSVSEMQSQHGVDLDVIAALPPTYFTWPNDPPFLFGEYQFLQRKMQVIVTVLDASSSQTRPKTLGTTKIRLGDLIASSEAVLQRTFAVETSASTAKDWARMSVEAWTIGGNRMMTNEGTLGMDHAEDPLFSPFSQNSGDFHVAGPPRHISNPEIMLGQNSSLRPLRQAAGVSSKSESNLGGRTAAAAAVEGAAANRGIQRAFGRGLTINVDHANGGSNERARSGTQEDTKKLRSKEMARYFLQHNLLPNKEQVVVEVGLMRANLLQHHRGQDQGTISCHLKAGLESASSMEKVDIFNPEWNQCFAFGKQKTLTGFEDVLFSLKFRGEGESDMEWFGKARLRLSKLLNEHNGEPIVKWLNIKSMIDVATGTSKRAAQGGRREKVIGYLCVVLDISVHAIQGHGDSANDDVSGKLVSSPDRRVVEGSKDGVHRDGGAPATEGHQLERLDEVGETSAQQQQGAEKEEGMQRNTSGPFDGDMNKVKAQNSKHRHGRSVSAQASDVTRQGHGRSGSNQTSPRHKRSFSLVTRQQQQQPSNLQTTPRQHATRESSSLSISSITPRGFVPMMRQASGSFYNLVTSSRGSSFNPGEGEGVAMAPMNVGGGRVAPPISPTGLTSRVAGVPASEMWRDLCAEQRDERKYVLSLQIQKACLDEQPDLEYVPNPFCTVTFLHRNVRMGELDGKTSVVRSSLEPVWNESMILGRERTAPIRGTESMLISVYNWNIQSSSKLIGSTTVNLKDTFRGKTLATDADSVAEDRTVQLVLPLKYPPDQDKPIGSVTISLSFEFFIM